MPPFLNRWLLIKSLNCGVWWVPMRCSHGSFFALFYPEVMYLHGNRSMYETPLGDSGRDVQDRVTMDEGEARHVGRSKGVPDWLNTPLWSSHPTSPSATSIRNDDMIHHGNVDGVADTDEDTRSKLIGIQTGNQRIYCDNPSTSQHQNDEDGFGNSVESPPIPQQASGSRLYDPNFKRCSSFDARPDQFLSELSEKVINLTQLRRLASKGIPDFGGLRATVWKLLLGYLPLNRDYWESQLVKKRREYGVFRQKLLVNPSEVTRRMEGANGQDKQDDKKEGGLLRRHEITHGDHPLSLGKTSVWHQFFQDVEMAKQIERDVKRTHPDMHFFSGNSSSSIENQEAMKNILLIYAKLNPGIQYVQGMNEVLAPLYYVFKTDPSEANSVNTEADAFFCFVQLLGDFQDHFCQQLDNSPVGIRSTIARLTSLLKKHDEELWRHLEVTTKVNPQFYAFRWITLLLTQEFSFPNCLRLWDSLLSNPHGPLEILLRVCCAMLIYVRSHLLAGDFTANLKLLQNYPFVDPSYLLHMANELST